MRHYTGIATSIRLSVSYLAGSRVEGFHRLDSSSSVKPALAAFLSPPLRSSPVTNHEHVEGRIHRTPLAFCPRRTCSRIDAQPCYRCWWRNSSIQGEKHSIEPRQGRSGLPWTRFARRTCVAHLRVKLVEVESRRSLLVLEMAKR